MGQLTSCWSRWHNLTYTIPCLHGDDVALAGGECNDDLNYDDLNYDDDNDNDDNDDHNDNNNNDDGNDNNNNDNNNNDNNLSLIHI